MQKITLTAETKKGKVVLAEKVIYNQDFLYIS
jgi:hypothetical protein